MLKSAVAMLLRVLQRGCDARDARFPDADFVIESDTGKPVALTVLTEAPDQAVIARVADQAARQAGALSAWYCASATSPHPREADAFATAMQAAGVDARLFPLAELPVALGQDTPLDVGTFDGIRDVRLAAFVANLAKHGRAAAGELERGGPAHRLANLIAYGREHVPPDYHVLTRQFPHATVGELLAHGGDLRARLGIGTNVRPVTVVLSDLKNFSKLVHAVHPATLNEIMGRYYLNARTLVWQYHGVLDKFIGDAVLAIFNYPAGERVGEESAVRFAQDLIEMGRGITGELLSTINDVIETGTRVGIASGELWTVDIGYEDLEVSFVGDVINLAARLEGNADVNGVLLDNITYNLLKRRSPEFLAGLNATERTLDVAAVKGQANAIRAWRIAPRDAPAGP
jgi:class 3 adenylate cyclase